MESIGSGKMALFDLDNTLLAGDSDHAWGEFLISEGLVDGHEHRNRNDEFYEQYKQGKLDIHGYVQFTMNPILGMSSTERNQLHARFMQKSVTALVLDTAKSLVVKHKNAGDVTVIITATNEFITAPIADLFQVDHLISTELEQVGERYTGSISGIPCYQLGKVEKLQQWLDSRDDDLQINDSVFYSDSINDLPLLARVATPIVVDPDELLEQEARTQNWKIISLRT